MYILGYHGNNLYPSYLRLFETTEDMIQYLIKYGDIEKISWKCWELEPNEDKAPVNIRKPTLVKWVKEYQEQNK